MNAYKIEVLYENLVFLKWNFNIPNHGVNYFCMDYLKDLSQEIGSTIIYRNETLVLSNVSIQNRDYLIYHTPDFPIQDAAVSWEKKVWDDWSFINVESMRDILSGGEGFHLGPPRFEVFEFCNYVSKIKWEKFDKVSSIGFSDYKTSCRINYATSIMRKGKRGFKR